MIVSCGFLKNEPSQFSKEEGVTLTDSVETLGVDLRTRVKRLGAKEKREEKKCLVRFSIIKNNKAFQKNYMKVGGYGASESVEAHAVAMAPIERLKIEETNGSGSGQKEYNFAFLVHGGI